MGFWVIYMGIVGASEESVTASVDVVFTTQGNVPTYATPGNVPTYITAGRG